MEIEDKWVQWWQENIQKWHARLKDTHLRYWLLGEFPLPDSLLLDFLKMKNICVQCGDSGR